MIRSDRLWPGRLLIHLWILILFYTVAESRRSEKCTTGDGREGLCVVKRYCREASQHELLPCERDEENYCCPIPTTQRSAPTPPPFIIDKPREEYPYRPEPDVKKNTNVYRDPNRDDQANNTPVQDNKRYNPPQTRPVALPKDDRRVIGRPDPPVRPRDPIVPQRNPHNRPPNRVNVVRPTERGHFYTTKDVIEFPRVTSRPRWNDYDKVPDRKNRTTTQRPITFPDSVPRQVPACGVKPYDLFIAGGQESGKHEWPWMTAIFRRHPDSRPKIFLCGGSLINTKYVLTAAHCFVNNYVILPASSFVVRLGSNYLNSGEEYTVANLIIHSNHSGSDFFNDIALVRLASEVYITDKIAPICLPSLDMMHQSLVGRLATVAGWGDTAFRTSGTRILQHVTVPIVSGEDCFSAYSRVRGAAFLARGSDHVICAGLMEGGKDACLGDSGGPLMIRRPDDTWTIVGIVSLGYKCAEPGYPGVYTRVTHYMSWIKTNMKRY